MLERRLDRGFQCEVDGEVEYEFPVYNQQEMVEGLWDPEDAPRSYGGLRIYAAPGLHHMFTSLFPYMQVSSSPPRNSEARQSFQIELRRSSLRREDDDSDLFQCYQGSKFCAGAVEALVTLEEDEEANQCVEVKVRGPGEAARDCFYFAEEILRSLDHVSVLVGVLADPSSPSVDLRRSARCAPGSCSRGTS